MKRAEKAEKIFSILNELYPEPPIPLDHQDAYTLLVAVLLSAQCTDERVNKVTPGLFKKAATPQAMAKLSVEDILESIRSCGLAPTKAKNIHKLSQTLASASYDFTIRLWNVRKQEMRRKLVGHDGGVRDVSFSPDGETLVSGSDDATVRVWSVASGSERIVCEGHDGAVLAVAYHPNGKFVASAGLDQTIRICDVRL